MNANEYQAAAQRTYAYQEKTGSRVDCVMLNAGLLTQDESQRLIHGILGMIGESSEIVIASQETCPEYWENLAKEIGDWFWYAAIATTALGITLETLIAMSSFEGIARENESLCAGQMGEMLKKWLFYGKPMDKAAIVQLMAKSIAMTKSRVQRLTNFGFTFHTILDLNIMKLKKRFPESFTAADAIARVDA